MTPYRFLLAVCALAFLIGAVPAGAGQASLTIDFSSTALRDGATTADWDTVSGTLHLPEFSASELGAVPVSNCSRVAVAGDYAFVAAGTQGLDVVDISNPAAPALVYAEGGGHDVRDVEVYGDLLFAAGGSSGLTLYDITDPTSPVWLTTDGSYSSLWGLAARGTMLYLADGTNGLKLLYLAGTIYPLSVLNTPGTALDVDAAGGIAFVADNTALRIVDVSDPLTPVEISSYAAAGASSVQMVYPLVYLGTYAGMEIIDISNPATPTLVGSYPALDLVTVSVKGDYAAVTTLTDLHIVDVRDPSLPAAQAILPTGDESGGAVTDGGRIFWTDGDTFRIVESAMPVAMNYFHTPGLGDGWMGFASEGRRLYANRVDLYGNRWVSVYDATDAMNPVFTGEVQIPNVLGSDLSAIAAWGGYVYSAGWEDGLQVIDARDPVNPVVVNQVPFSALGGASDLVLDGTYLLVAESDSVSVMDVYDPANPVLLYKFSGPGWNRTKIDDHYAYYASGNTVHVYSLIAAEERGSVALPGSFAQVLTADGDNVYAEVDDKLVAVDVTDPAIPAVLGTPLPVERPRYAEVVGDRLAVLSDHAVTFVDISDPANLTQLSQVFLPDYGNPSAYEGTSMARIGDYLHVGRFGDVMPPEQNDLHQVIPILNHRVDPHQDYARTISLTPFNQGAISSRILPAVRTDSVSISVNGATGDNGMWQYALGASGGTSNFYLITVSSLVDPMVDEVTYEWAYPEPLITGIADIPNDQGKQVRLAWMKSGRDFTGPSSSPERVTEYSVYRRREPGLAPGVLAGLSRPPAAMAGLAAPPGDWDYIASVPADGIPTDGHYAMVVPTLADSTIAAGMRFTTFYIRARTDSVGLVFDSAPDSGYSVDNLAPSVPMGLSATGGGGGGIALVWDPNPEEDVQYYNVYRGSSDGFVPDDLSRIGSAASPGYTDPAPGGDTYYKVTAVDFSGNEGGAAPTHVTTGAPRPGVANRFHLYPAAPNPFRAGARIAYEVPEGGAEVSLVVYDIQGRAVRRLLSGRQPQGVAEVRWDGRDDTGRDLPGGIYFLKFAAPGFQATARVVRLR